MTFPWPQPPNAPTSAWHSQQVSSRVLRTTLLTSSSVILRGGPDLGASLKPYMRCSAKRLRHLLTVLALPTHISGDPRRWVCPEMRLTRSHSATPEPDKTPVSLLHLFRSQRSFSLSSIRVGSRPIPPSHDKPLIDSHGNRYTATMPTTTVAYLHGHASMKTTCSHTESRDIPVALHRTPQYFQPEAKRQGTLIATSVHTLEIQENQ